MTNGKISFNVNSLYHQFYITQPASVTLVQESRKSKTAEVIVRSINTILHKCLRLADHSQVTKTLESMLKAKILEKHQKKTKEHISSMSTSKEVLASVVTRILMSCAFEHHRRQRKSYLSENHKLRKLLGFRP